MLFETVRLHFCIKPTWPVYFATLWKYISETSFFARVHSLEISQGSFTLLSKFPFVYKQKSKQWRSDLVGQIICWQFPPSLPPVFAWEERAEERHTHNKKSKEAKKFFDLGFFVLVVVDVVVVVVEEEPNKKAERVERS
jgi:hypothetical protein